MKQIPRRKSTSNNFFVPGDNVLDLRSRGAARKKISRSQIPDYFETDYEEKDRVRFLSSFWHQLQVRRKNRKERQLAEKLSRINASTLDIQAQKLLLEIQKYRLHFAQHGDVSSLQQAESRYRALKTVIRTPREFHRKKQSLPESPAPLAVARDVQPKRLVNPVPLNFSDPFINGSMPRSRPSRHTAPDHFFIPSQRERPPVFISEDDQKSQFPPRPLLPRIAAFAVWSLVLLSPLFFFGWLSPSFQSSKGKVLGASTEAVKYLQSAGDALAQLDFSLADKKFDSALQNFSSAQQELDHFALFFRLIPVKGAEGIAAQHLVTAGREISEAGKYMTQTAAVFTSIDAKNILGSPEQGSLTAALVSARDQLVMALPHLERARQEIEGVSVQDIPAEYRDSLQLVQQGFPTVVDQLRSALDFSDVLLQVLGHENPQRYLVLFQNSQELRPTGGFISSVAVMTIDQGVIRKIDVPGGGVYDISGQLLKKVVAPQPLHLVNPDWNIQDAGWFADVPTSAQKIISFYSASGGSSVDGVMFMTPDVLGSLLELTGPVYMDDYGLTVDKDNFLELIQEEKEKVKDSKTPKAIISDLTPLLLNKAFDIRTENSAEVLAILDRLFSQRDLILYFHDKELQQLVSSFGWSGELRDADRDFLHISHANISGGKTDLLIEERVEHTAELQPDGRVTDMVTVTRTHRGSVADPEGAIRNLSYIRFFVPAGSRLLEANGFDRIDQKLFLVPNQDAVVDDFLREKQGDVYIDEYSQTRVNNESGKTVFGNWVAVEAGKSTQVTIRYELPFRLKLDGLLDQTDHYSLLFQRQAGLAPFIFSSRLKLAPQQALFWYGPQDSLESNTDGLTLQQMMDTDLFYGAVIGPQP